MTNRVRKCESQRHTPKGIYLSCVNDTGGELESTVHEIPGTSLVESGTNSLSQLPPTKGERQCRLWNSTSIEKGLGIIGQGIKTAVPLLHFAFPTFKGWVGAVGVDRVDRIHLVVF
jgi:hypothetical protein